MRASCPCDVAVEVDVGELRPRPPQVLPRVLGDLRVVDPRVRQHADEARAGDERVERRVELGEQEEAHGSALLSDPVVLVVRLREAPALRVGVVAVRSVGHREVKLPTARSPDRLGLMAPTKTTTTTTTTTTLRVPTHLRDEIARIAELRGTSMLAVVTDAVSRLGRDEWWSSVRGALDDLTPTDAETYKAVSEQLDTTASDGLDGY